MEIVLLKDNLLLDLYHLFNFALKANIKEKAEITLCLQVPKITTVSGYRSVIHHESLVPCFVVKTKRGPVYIEVSEEIFWSHGDGDEIDIVYQIGRFDGELSARLK